MEDNKYSDSSGPENRVRGSFLISCSNRPIIVKNSQQRLQAQECRNMDNDSLFHEKIKFGFLDFSAVLSWIFRFKYDILFLLTLCRTFGRMGIGDYAL